MRKIRGFLVVVVLLQAACFEDHSRDSNDGSVSEDSTVDNGVKKEKPDVPSKPVNEQGCEYDLQCKGDRICEQNQCVFTYEDASITNDSSDIETALDSGHTNGSGGCDSDEQCKGDRICEAGKCVNSPPTGGTGGQDSGIDGTGGTDLIDASDGETGGTGGTGGTNGNEDAGDIIYTNCLDDESLCIPNLLIRFDASNRDSVVVEDGNDVQIWKNLAPTGTIFDAVQDEPELQPSLIENELNGLPVIRFDGSDVLSVEDEPRLDIGTAPDQSRTLFVVTVHADATSPQRIISKSVGGSGNTDWAFAVEPNSLYFIWGTGTVADGGAWLLFYDVSPNDCHVVSMDLDQTAEESGSKNAYVDGELAAEGTYSTKTSANDAPLFIGGQHNIALWYFEGDIAEILLYEVKLSDENRASIETYLLQKWCDG